jgi:hypothetical protein
MTVTVEAAAQPAASPLPDEAGSRVTKEVEVEVE